jgi:hypothetical protein
MSYSATPSIMSQLASSAFWPAWSASRSQAMSVYLLACGTGRTLGRGAVGPLERSAPRGAPRPRRIGSMLTLCRCRSQVR